jgi:hypothetical protein
MFRARTKPSGARLDHAAYAARLAAPQQNGPN